MSAFQFVFKIQFFEETFEQAMGIRIGAYEIDNL
jgi:hypothetical protein